MDNKKPNKEIIYVSNCNVCFSLNSLMINPINNTFYCKTCGLGGILNESYLDLHARPTTYKYI